MGILNFTKSSYVYYKTHVKDNENTTYDQACRKMTRNMILAHKADSTGYTAQMYQYGSLWFIANKNNEICWIKNYGKTPEGWKVNKIKYLKLNKQLHIDEDVTLWDLVKKDAKYKVKRTFSAARQKLQFN